MPATYAPLGKATAAFGSTSFTYSPLLSDGDDVVSRPGNVASGLGILKRGTIVKIDAATGAVTLPALATDCNGILVDDTDATSAIAPCNVYVGGKFKADAIIWPAALGHGVVTDNLRDNDIQIESVLYTDGTMVKSVPTEAETAAAKKRIAENKADAEKATKVAATAAAEEKPSDSSWPYLTAEEREKSPQLANPRTEPEEEDDEEKDKEGEEKKAKQTFTQPHTPPQHNKK